MSETKLKESVLKYLRTNLIYCFKVHGSKFMEPGIPDIVACVNGKFLGIELKRPGAKNEQSEQQQIHEANIKTSNGVYLLADSLEEVVETVEKLKTP